MQHPRFYVEDVNKSWIVHDRSRIIEGQPFRNPLSAEYVCAALNHFHRTKANRHDNAA